MKKIKKTKSISILGIIVCLLGVILFGTRTIAPEIFGNNTSSEVNTVNVENLENVIIKTGETITEDFISNNNTSLKTYFFNVGQADSILIQNNEKNMLIDAGNNEDGEMLVNNLKQLNVEKIDYLIGTHPHEDHIGGMDNIINNFEIGTIYMPNVQTNTKTFEDVLAAVSNKNLKIETPKVNDTFLLGEANCKILSVTDDEDNLNQSSIVIQLNFKDLSYLFMGDAEKEIEESIDVGKVNILKVGHHGSDTSSSLDFINKIAPEVSIISVGKDNSYGHPSDDVIKRLENIGSKVYRTDEVGNIFIEQN